MFPAADSACQIPSTFPMDQSQTFSTMDSGPFASAYGGYDERPGYQGNMTNTEEGVDATRGPRLTQEQLGQLEVEFTRNYKPPTDHKRALAESMGVDYSKVTNWFQNRRAKAKHEGHAQQRSDRSLKDVGPPLGTAPIDYRRISDSQDSACFSSPEQAPMVPDELGATIDFSCLNDMPPQYYSQPLTVPINQGFDASALLPPDSLDAGNMGSYIEWPGNNLYSDNKISTSSIHEINSLGLLSASPSVQSPHIDFGKGNAEWHPPMYNTIVNGHLGGNSSSHSFGTSLPEEGEQASFFTPPQETSPLPGVHQERVQHDRQTSNSSDLAENLDIVHIQQPPAGLGLQETSNSTSGQQQAATTGLLTPEVSPDTMAPKLPFAAGHDLASRRKRPRPAALQPEPNRSASFAGATVNSPSLRVSPPSSGKISPVRRVKSTGNPLNVMTGRVKKPGAMTAQISPHNLESCFKVVSLPDNQPNTDHHAHVHQASGADGNSVAARSPTTFHQRRQGTWPESSAQLPLPSSSWQPAVNDRMPNSHLPSEPGWTLQQVDHTNGNFGIPPSQPNHVQHYSYHLPPQSAPSHVTSFDAASLMSGNPGTDWRPSYFQPEPCRDDTRLSVPFRPSHLPHHSHSGPFEYCQPLVPSYQPYGHSAGAFFPYGPFSNRTPTPPHKALDIKVETGPPPPKEMMQASQERKEYTFENAFPDDPHFLTGSKK